MGVTLAVPQDSLPLGTIFGLPTHPLIIHAVVVGIPLAVLATVAVACRPSWRRTFGWWTVALDGAVLVAVYIARESGEWLLEKFPQPSPEMAQHAALGTSLIWFVLVLLMTAVTMMVTDRVSKGLLAHAVAGIVVVVALVTLVQTVRTGHTGSRAVWDWVTALTTVR
jgi:heme/copper-type cytochrome/quinol oxidase subunit 4